jgi:hypothetical protein
VLPIPYFTLSKGETMNILKTLVCTGLLSISAYSQSYLVQNNGVLLSINETGSVFDLNQFVKTYEIIFKGKSFLINKEKNLTVITKDGFVINKGDKLIPAKTKITGGSFILSDKNEISIVRNDGMVFTYDKIEEIKKLEAIHAGGNFLVLQGKKSQETMILTIDTENGFYTLLNKSTLDSLKIDIAKIKTIGGNYFITNDGVVYTVSSTGIVSSKESMGLVLKTTKVGGNFFVDSENVLRVVMSNGYLLIPYIPSAMGKVKSVGYNYFTNDQDELFTVVDKISEAELNSPDAAVFDGALKKIINAYDVNFDARNINIFSF